MYKIEVFRGTSEDITFEIKDENGEIYVPADGEIVVFGVRSAGSNVLLINKTATVSGNNVIVSLVPADTVNLIDEYYVYDVSIKIGDEFYNVIPKSDFIVRNGVTMLEAING